MTLVIAALAGYIFGKVAEKTVVIVKAEVSKNKKPAAPVATPAKKAPAKKAVAKKAPVKKAAPKKK